MRLNREAVRAIRERSGITQKAVAEEARIDRPNYCKIEKGDRTATDSQIVAIAKALVVPLSAIAELDDNEAAVA